MSFDMQLAADLFDAAIDDSRWSSLLERLNLQIGSLSGAIVSVNMAEQTDFQLLWGSPALTPEIHRTYNEKFSHFEADGIPVIKNSPRFQVLTEYDLWPNEPNLRDRTDFVGLREMLGIDHRIVARLNEDRSWFTTHAVQFALDNGPVRQAQRATFAAYLPFVAQTVKLAQVFMRLKARFQAVLTALDRYAVPVVIVDSERKVIIQNHSADSIMALKSGLYLDSWGHLRLYDAEADGRLALAARAASATAAGENNTPESVFTAARREGGDPLCLEVSPLRDSDRELEPGFKGALVKIYDPMHHPALCIDAFATVYGLTDAEMSVARLLVNGASTDEIADTRSCSPATVRTQIKTILHKTDSRTRTDLIRRALSAHMPILDHDPE
ncbi:MAG: helix-turn-helix transcriptional regulator [Inquilinaceae bacterium]